MTEIEEKALALVNEFLTERGWGAIDIHVVRSRYGYCFAALCRAIEAHEADKAMYEQRISDQAKAFSDAVQEALDVPVVAQNVAHILCQFILPNPEPDPLVEIAREMTLLDGVVRTDSQKAAIREGRAGGAASDDFYDRLRMALPARGYKIERIEQ